jgi:hypothetical protein
MSTPEKLGLKLILEYVLESENISLRRKTLAFALEMASALNLDESKVEEAIKAELQADLKTSNLWMKRILLELEPD